MLKTGMISIVVVLVIAASAAAEKKTVTISLLDTDVPPYIVGAGSSLQKDRPGVLVELMHMLEQELDIGIEFIRYPMSRSIKQIARGEIDGCFPLSFKPERLKLAQYPMVGNEPDRSKRLAAESLSIYTRKDSTVAWDGESIQNLTEPIGVHRSYAIAESLKKTYPVVDVTKHTEQNFERLIRKRISAVVDFEMPADIILNSHPRLKEKIIKLNPPLVTKQYYLVLSHQFVETHPVLSKRIWTAIGKIREKNLVRLMEVYTLN